MEDLAKRHLEDDPYSYRKYGAKGPTLSRDSTRHYFRCNMDGCPARKVIEISHIDNSTNVQSVGEHLHPPPPTDIRGNKQRKPRAWGPYEGIRDEASPSRSFAPRMPTSEAGAAPLDTAATHDPNARIKRASAQNVSNIVALVRNGQADDADDVVSGLQHHPSRFAAPQPLDFFSPRPAPAAAASSRPSSDDDKGASKVRGGSASPSSPKRGVTSTPALASAVGDDGAAQAAPATADVAANYPGHEGVVFTDPRTEVMTWRVADGTLGLLFRAPERDYADRYAWRKYGKKHIKGYSEDCPRFYWRCTDKGCDIKRHTQSTATGDTEVFYYGRHNHGVPDRKYGRGIKRTSPNTEVLSPNRPAAAALEARPARPARRARKVHTDEWDDEGECPASPAFSQDSQRSDVMSEFDDFSRGDGSVDLPGGEGRCPLFFLACVAAKEPSAP